MHINIFTHYDETVPGVHNGIGVVGGEFSPAGDGVPAGDLAAKASGKDGTLAEWVGARCRVRIVERQDRHSDDRVLAVWISATDVQGTEHTVELPQGASEYSSGFVTVTID